MRVLPITRVETNRGVYDLGLDPFGYMTEDGFFYTYDGQIVDVKDDDTIKAWDEDSVDYDARNIKELIEEADMIDGWVEI